MELTEQEETILRNIDEKLRWSRKKLKPMLESNKIRSQETGDSDECMENTPSERE